MKRHGFDPASFVFGLLFLLLALFFLTGDQSVADIGAKWVWPAVTLTPGLLMVLYGAKRVLVNRAADDTVELEERDAKEPADLT